MTKKRWIAIGVVVFIALMTNAVVYYYYYLQIKPSPSPPSVIRHIFKSKEIYPTKSGGREWLINMDNPTSDGVFDPQSTITKQHSIDCAYNSWTRCMGTKTIFAINSTSRTRMRLPFAATSTIYETTRMSFQFPWNICLR